MFLLAEHFPPAERLRRLPLSRDQFILLVAATNEFFLGLDIYLAHRTNGLITTNEWIPIIFGPIAGALLLAAVLLALRNQPLATVLATLVLAASIVVGLLGAYFHVIRAALPTAPLPQRISIQLLVWGPPILGPLMFSLVGLLGISAAWIEHPADSGRLVLPGDRRLQLPYSKTRAYLFMVSLGSLATVVSSVLDHARAEFENPWLWLPTIAGVLATTAALALGALDRPRRNEVLAYVVTMLLMIAVGALGALLHVQTNLTARGTIVGERFIRGAPILAPLLFSNIGLLGLLALLPSEEHMEPSAKLGG